MLSTLCPFFRPKKSLFAHLNNILFNKNLLRAVMEYLKKVVVLNQVAEGYSLSSKRLSAICRIEVDNGVGKLFLSAVNFSTATNGEYKLFISDCKRKIFCFPMAKRPQTERWDFEILPDVEKGFSAGIFHFDLGLPILIAFHGEKESIADTLTFKKAVYSHLEKHNKVIKSDFLEAYTPVSEQLNAKNEYNDEAVATENYFLLEEDFKDKLKIFEVIDNENARTKNDMPFNPSQKEEKEIKDGNFHLPNETSFSECEEFSESHPYYETARQELEEVLLKFPTEEALERNLPESRFVKINYSQDKYYVVGVIKENGREKYVCYGIPAKYSLEPPKELKGFCSFIPLSIFDLNGDGYWMMFQDAISGECVKKFDKN